MSDDTATSPGDNGNHRAGYQLKQKLTSGKLINIRTILQMTITISD